MFGVDTTSGSLLYSQKMPSLQPFGITVYGDDSQKTSNGKYLPYMNTFTFKYIGKWYCERILICTRSLDCSKCKLNAAYFGT